jgi:segregation and condensation protein A
VRVLEQALAERTRGQLGHWAAWTVMAATLTELWSRLKLPSDAPAAIAAAAEAEALRRNLLTRAAMGDRAREGGVAADWLDQRAQLGQDAFRRGLPEVSVTRRGGDLAELLRACLVALHVPDEHAAAGRPRPPPLWTDSDALRRLIALLPGLPDGSPLWALLPPIAGDAPARPLRCRAAVASTLIAGLEQARDGALVLDQGPDPTVVSPTAKLISAVFSSGLEHGMGRTFDARCLLAKATTLALRHPVDLPCKAVLTVSRGKCPTNRLTLFVTRPVACGRLTKGADNL